MATYLEAIREALQEEMRRDESVFLIGEDIGEYGGAFKLTKGLIDEFGDRRVVDTPISEAGFTGAAIGAAMNGLRPVVEYQFAAFISCAFDQITNFAAKTHYRIGVPIPVVFRAPSGGGIHGGPFHSQSPEMYFANTAGLKIATPGTAGDAKGLLKTAIRDDDPVLFFEHKYLYRRIEEDLPGEDHLTPLGTAAVRTTGDRLTIVTYGAMLHVCLEATRRLEEEEGYEGAVEVVDLRSLVPMDSEAVRKSVDKTGRLLIVHEDNRTGGIAGEITSRVIDEAFFSLDAPIRRVTAPDTPVPFSPPMERAYLPDADTVTSAARNLLEF